MKKVIALLLCVLLFTGSALAEGYGYNGGYDVAWEGTGAACGDQMTWVLEGSTLYITGSGDMYDFPNGAPWMSSQSTITRVVLSDGITYVGAYAFQNYDALSTVEFGNSLVSIGKDAFSGCDGLTSITLPATFKKFGENSLRSCTNLKEIHCSGNFPRFDENCLWDTYATIYFSASNPWPVSLIEQLENAFHNRIEFRSSDGTDPYVPTQPTEATTQPPTVPTETFWVTEPTTQPVTQATVPVYTQPTVPVYTQPTTVATQPPTTIPQTTQPTIVFGNTQASQPEPYRPAATDGSSIFGLLIVLIMLTILVTGALLFRSAGKDRRRKKKRKYRR